MKGIIADFTHIKEPLEVAALSDTLLRNLEENTMILQLSQHHYKNISMGIDDTRAPYFHDGIDHYKANGYTVHTRNSGGRSVANDPGVLNFSILMKSNMGATEAYMMFYHFIKDALKPLDLDIRVGIVEGAYCPGKFDISINHKKIAGTAQRKIIDNILVGCYLSINGNQQKRSQIISDFYKITQDVIQVDPIHLTTLEDELNKPLDVETVKALLINHFETLTTSLSALDMHALNQEALEKARDRVQNQDNRYLNR